MGIRVLQLSAGSDFLGTGIPLRVLYALGFSLKTQHGEWGRDSFKTVNKCRGDFKVGGQP